MSSEVSDPQTALALDRLSAAVDGLFEAGVTPVDAADATRLVREVECQARRVGSVQVALLDEIGRAGLHRHDGHASAKVMVRHVAHLSDPAACRRASAARCLGELPAVLGAFRAGRIGFCQIDRIARAFANLRVRERLVGQDAALACEATMRGYREFDALVTDWVRLVDEDGTCDRAQRSHVNRDARIVQDFDLSWKLFASAGSLQGAVLRDILARFVKAEWLTDWDQARTRYGPDATGEHLARTDAQRRFDALFEIFTRAAGSLPGTNGSQVVTNLVMDLETFERVCRRMTGDQTRRPDATIDDLSTPGDAFHPVNPARPGFRCSTLDGDPIDPTETVADALIGHIRRVIIGADSTVIDLSRRSRLFTGAAALAVKLASTECYWPGCHVNVTDCQNDHLTAWNSPNAGATNPQNGGPACAKHNRLKQRGYTVTRDPHGHWHTHHPDGTEIE